MAHPVLDTTKEKMEGALRNLAQQLDGVRTGKASPALVENITALYYGAPTRIRELGNIATPEPRVHRFKRMRTIAAGRRCAAGIFDFSFRSIAKMLRNV